MRFHSRKLNLALLGVLLMLGVLLGAQVPRPATGVFVAAPPASGTNPIAASRQACGDTSAPNACWAAAGVEGGIPSGSWTQSGSTISAYTGTAATINTALSGCGTNHFVQLGAGTFTLSTAITITNSNCELRGSGADQTKLFVNNDATMTGTFLGAAIKVGSTTANIGCTGCGGAGPNNTATWSAGYSQGTTTITLSGHANMTVGHTIWLDQNTDNFTPWPDANGAIICNQDEPCSWEGGGSWYRDNKPMLEAHKVVSCGTSTPGAACTSNTIVISPGVISPTFRSAQSPGAWWGSSGAILQNVGVTNLSIDYTGAGTNVSGIGFTNCTNCWAKGNRILFLTDGNQTFLINIINGFHTTIKDNYLFGTVCSNLNISMGQCQIQYTISPQGATMSLVENNIIQTSVTPIAANDPDIGSVYAYNYVLDSYYSPGPQDHNSGDMMNLWEGNNVGAIWNDSIHGTHMFLTYLRNHMDGTAQNTTGVSSYGGLVFWAHNRFHNALGNVFGSNAFTTYQINETSDSFNGVYGLGFAGTHGCSAGCLSNDSVTRTSFFRWGNWDNVTSTGDTGSNDQTGIRFNTGEVPSGLANFANAVPSSNTLPNSLYLSAKPAFFQSNTWPPIGPDVASGNAPNTSSAPTGGHANKIPARVCFESRPNDGAYGSSYGPENQRIRTFNAVTCYGS